MRAALRRPSAEAGDRALAWAERLLVLAGAALLAWSALVLIETRVSQRLAHETLVTMPPVAPHTARRTPPPAGSPLAELSIPRIHLSAVVLHGSDARTLRAGVGHIENTAFPGEPGNVAIAGHRDSFFRPLQHVRVGDDVVLETPAGRWHYRVSSLRVVRPSDVTVLNPTPNATLTLVTCYPFWIFGHAPDRFIVRATRIGDPVSEGRTAPVPARPRLLDTKSRGATDDESLARQAIERFRLSYNARFASHGEQRPGGALSFQACQVVLDGALATATCQTASPSPDSLEVLERTFTLRKLGGAWAIESVSMRP